MRQTRVFGALLLSIVIILSAGLADADEYVMSQKNRKFHPKLLMANVGDTVVFINDDRFAHNIYSETPGYEFNIRKQLPGDRDVITLDKAGEFVLHCAIHPRMEMKIIVQ
jgi:plastocyanin